MDAPLAKQRELSQWYTPRALARRVVEWADVRPGTRVLEPSAGRGVIATEARDRGGLVECVELDADNARDLRRMGFTVHCGDFLDYEPAERTRFDVVVANPPYEKGAEATHLRHALRHARRVVAIVRLQALSSWDRWEGLWSGVWLRRIAICVKRPAFTAHGAGGTFDVAVVDLGHWPDERPHGGRQTPALEWWPDDWRGA